MSEQLPSNPEDFEISQDIAEICASLGEEFGFDSETLIEISSLPFEQAFEAAYSYLTQAGLNADEVLSSWLEDNPEIQ